MLKKYSIKNFLHFFWLVGLTVLFIFVVEYTLTYSSSPGEEQLAFIFHKLTIYGLIPSTMFLLNVNGMNLWPKVQWYKMPMVCGFFLLFLRIKAFFLLDMSSDLIRKWVLYYIPEAVICVCLTFIYTRIYSFIRHKVCG